MIHDLFVRPWLWVFSSRFRRRQRYVKALNLFLDGKGPRPDYHKDFR